MPNDRNVGINKSIIVCVIMDKKTSDPRKQVMLNWLSNDIKLDIEKCEPASEDASFRRYFRVTLRNPPRGSLIPKALSPKSQGASHVEQTPDSLIVMDAPPEKEPLDTFLKTTRLLRTHNINAPHIYAKNIAQGFLLLEDFGSVNYVDKLHCNATELYPLAIDTIVLLQLACFKTPQSELPTYSAQKLDDEMQLFEDWYLSVHLKHKMTATQLKAWAELRAHLVRQCVQQPQVWVHRDYHSRNLMVLDKNSPGVIDYQDMVIGPLTYDLASIFKDCYIEWPRTQQLEWLQNYQQKLRHAAGEIEQATELSNIDFDQLVKWYDMTALQRHIKVLGIFCRLNYRDNKPNYINDLPMVKRYVLEVLPRYPQLRTFLNEFSSLLN